MSVAAMSKLQSMLDGTLHQMAELAESQEVRHTENHL
jgi:hypothetical protein